MNNKERNENRKDKLNNEEENEQRNEDLEENFEDETLEQSEYNENTEDENIQDESNVNDDFDFKFINTRNKHKMAGKHTLNRDVLFTGKDDDEDEEEEDTSSQFNEEISIKNDSIFEQESKNHPEYMNRLTLEQDVFELLKQNTNIDFTENRRKPKRQDFNHYFEMLVDHLRFKYTKSEIFVTLAYYFTDNIFNMFKLLYRKHATIIIEELREKGYLDDLDSINFV